MKQFMDGYATHLPMLVAAVIGERGPVLELGCGEYSTFTLHELCRGLRVFGEAAGRLVSLEANPDWFQKFVGLQTPWHTLKLVTDWASEPFDQQEWGVAFVDHSHGDRRHLDVQRLAHKARIIVVHDSENPDYVYDHVGPSFKYAYTDNRFVPWTTVLSNFVPLDDLGPGPKEYVRVGFPK